MIEAIQSHGGGAVRFRGHEVTAPLNSLLHARPDSGASILTGLDGKPVFASSKILDRGDLCDEICATTIPWLVTVQCMMVAYFPSSGEPVTPGIARHSGAPRNE